MGVPELGLTPGEHSLPGLLRRIVSTGVTASPVYRYPAAALVGVATAGLAALVSSGPGSHALLLAHPLTAAAAGIGGIGAGAALLGGIGLGGLVLLPALAIPSPSLMADGPFWISLVLVAAVVGGLSTSLRRAQQRTQHQRIEANQFAAALHLRVAIAEREIDRMRTRQDDASGRDAPDRPPGS